MQKGTDATTEERGGQLIAKKDAVRARPGSGRRGATMSASGSDLRGPTVELLRVALNRTEMPFAKFIEEESPKFAHDSRYSKGLVRYKDLKDHIKNMQKSKYERDMITRRGKHLTDECAICLEALGPASDVTTTACKHSFHTFCLVETLGNGMCTSCPLCRTEVEKLVPGGLDGQSLKLIAKLRINIDAAQWCHKAIFDEIAQKAAHCQQDIKALWVRRYVPFTGSKKKRIRQRLHSLLNELEVLHAYSRVNVQGFARICGKIDRKMSSGLSKLILSNYVHNMGYYKDFAQDGNGLSMAMVLELKQMLEMMGGSMDDAEVKVGCSGMGVWSWRKKELPPTHASEAPAGLMTRQRQPEPLAAQVPGAAAAGGPAAAVRQQELQQELQHQQQQQPGVDQLADQLHLLNFEEQAAQSSAI